MFLTIEMLREKSVLFSNLHPIQTCYIHLPALFYKPVMFTNQYRARRGISVSTGFSLFRSSVCMYVCMSVCLEAPGHSFWAWDLKFGTQHLSRFRNFFEFQTFKGLLIPCYKKNTLKNGRQTRKENNKTLSGAQFSR